MSHSFETAGSDSVGEKQKVISRPTPAVFTFSDKEEGVERVRSLKENRYEEITNLIKAIRNHCEIKDIASLLQSFEDLIRAYQEALPVITKEENGVTPRFYVRALVELEDFINEVWKDCDGHNNLSKNISNALGPLRQKFREYVKDFEADLAKFRESSGEEEPEVEEKVEEESESSEDYEDKDEEDKKKKKIKESKPRKHQREDTEKEGSSVPTEKPKMFAKDAEIDVPLVLNKLNEIMASRGKERTDRRQEIELLYELERIAQQNNLGDAIACKIRFNIVSAIFDNNPEVNEPMKLEDWTNSLKAMTVLVLLLNTKNITLLESICEEEEEYENAPFFLHGCVLTAVERLDDEFTKLLEKYDRHSNEYVDHLKYKVQVTAIIEQVLNYIEHIGSTTEICRVYLRKIDHLYYKFDPTVLKKKNKELDDSTVTSVDVMEKLCNYIYAKDYTDRFRSRAILSHIHHHALHDNWFQARDLFLWSRLQEDFHRPDPPTQILYYRMMANLAWCAVRHSVLDIHTNREPNGSIAQDNMVNFHDLILN